jgi:hypothetical protein
MTRKVSRSASLLAAAAVFSLVATPALARDRWGGGGWGRGHDRVDAGDIFTGILIIGGIAAIASAASKSAKDKRERESRQDERYDDRDEGRNSSADYARDDNRSVSVNSGTGLDNAVNRCVDEVGRGSTTVEEVESVNRDAEGWRVTGSTGGGGNFSCTVDRDGRIRNVNIDGRAI